MVTLHQQMCQEISVFPQHHLMLLQWQTEEIQVLPQKKHRDAAKNNRNTSTYNSHSKQTVYGRQQIK